jgi:TIR domain
VDRDLSWRKVMAGKIFINYRRDDSPGTAGRLHDRLAQTFGRKNLFMDVDHIPAGVDFVEYLNSQVAACDVFLAVIGPNWLDAKDDDGRRRFDNPDDFVTVEIAAALTRKIRVIPVLVDGARTPKAEKLPDSVKPLVRRNAVEVRNTNFGRDAEALANKLREALIVARPATGRWPFVASATMWLMAPGQWRTVAGSATALLLVGWVGLYQMGVPVWVPWTEQPDSPRAGAEPQRTAAVAELQRLNQEIESKTKEAADAEAQRMMSFLCRLQSVRASVPLSSAVCSSFPHAGTLKPGPGTSTVVVLTAVTGRVARG